mmetsp:Transcript_23641/g.54619  ORF Transcript_23641/g.54619 Transcript_23641/m.54619 type:complete len:82 (-) Transcript_23641:105-350(-)
MTWVDCLGFLEAPNAPNGSNEVLVHTEVRSPDAPCGNVREVREAVDRVGSIRRPRLWLNASATNVWPLDPARNVTGTLRVG